MHWNDCAVYTLTLSPCIDKSTRVDAFVPEKKLVCDFPLFEPGGGGLNVSKVLSRLGMLSGALYVSGGYTGRMLDEMVRHERYLSRLIHSDLQTRENFIVYEKKSHLQYRFGMPVNPLNKNELDAVLEIASTLGENKNFVISGSVHSETPVRFFKTLFRILKNKNTLIFCDTDRYTLRKILPLGPGWIKPNKNEWLHCLGKIQLNKKEFIHIGQKTSRTYGVRIVVSDGAKGTWLFHPEGDSLFFPSPSGIRVRSTVGAGDSMVGGIIYQLLQNKTDLEAVRFGMACAISTVQNPESEFCTAPEALHWYRKIKENFL